VDYAHLGFFLQLTVAHGRSRLPHPTSQRIIRCWSTHRAGMTSWLQSFSCSHPSMRTHSVVGILCWNTEITRYWARILPLFSLHRLNIGGEGRAYRRFGVIFVAFSGIHFHRHSLRQWLSLKQQSQIHAKPRQSQNLTNSSREAKRPGKEPTRIQGSEPRHGHLGQQLCLDYTERDQHQRLLGLILQGPDLRVSNSKSKPPHARDMSMPESGRRVENRATVGLFSTLQSATGARKDGV